jgi:hypothetical protein
MGGGAKDRPMYIWAMYHVTVILFHVFHVLPFMPLSKPLTKLFASPYILGKRYNIPTILHFQND